MNFPKKIIFGLVLSVGLIAGSARAQNAPAGPVQFPASSATNAPAVSPAPAPAAAPITLAPASSNPPQTATISSSDGDIHDISGPISIPYEWLWAAYFVGGLVLAGAIYAAWRLFRQQAKARAKLPYEVALERLETARELMKTDTVREYCFTVSEVIRVYIEQRFGEKAARSTTEEFLTDLLQQTDTPLAQHRRRLEDFLNHCDLSKFARWQFSVSEMKSMHESAREFILETRPQPETAKPARVDALAQPELIQAK
jgi:hypothetical protein